MNVFQNITNFIKSLFDNKDEQTSLPCELPILKILSIIKYRESYTDKSVPYSYSGGLSSGLLNSAKMIVNMLNELGVNGVPCTAKLAEVIDNNDIDREVTAFKPDVVIIEAIWVVPEKFDVLVKLHPSVKWIIRNHSNIPFLAQEGQAIGWLEKYITYKNVYIASNTHESVSDIKEIVTHPVELKDREGAKQKVVFFPNYYKSKVNTIWEFREGAPDVHIGCFGAVRPLKNHLQQALAAITFARQHGKKLYFHINSGRQEVGGGPVLNNLRSLFNGAVDSELVEEPWLQHDDFVKLISTMDISLQVSFSETFNIVSADAVAQGVPVVVSDEIFWVSDKYQAIPTSTGSIVEKLNRAYHDSRFNLHGENIEGLRDYNFKSHKEISKTIIRVFNDVDLYGI